MFSLVTKKPKKTVERNNKAAVSIQLWCFSPSFSLKLDQLAHYSAFFFMLPWHLSYSESTLWNVCFKKKRKKKKLYLSPVTCDSRRTHRYVLNLCNLVINVDPVCPIRYLSPVLLNRGELQTLQKLRLQMPVVSECDAKRAPRLFPGCSLMTFSSLMIHLPIIKHTSLSCLVHSKKA